LPDVTLYPPSIPLTRPAYTPSITPLPAIPLLQPDEEGSEASLDEYAQQLAESLMEDEDDDDDEFSMSGDDDGGGEDMSDEGIDDDENGGSDGDADGDEEGGGGSVGDKPRKKRVRGPTYADAADFAHILEADGDEYEGINPRLADWEEGRGGKHGKKGRR
jgi:hypothetical protein